jgi:hypothetical protein
MTDRYDRIPEIALDWHRDGRGARWPMWPIWTVAHGI